MPNESGRNAHGVKEYPPDEVLKASLLRYAQSRYTREEKKSALQKEHNLSIQNTKLAELEKKFDIPSVRKRIPAELAKQAVLDEVDKGGWEGSQHNGPDYIQTKLANRLVLLPRDVVRQIMLEDNPGGFDARYPGRKHKGTTRKPLTSVGPWREISGDGHEKLGHLALGMGEIGLPIYAFKDKWPDELLFMEVIPNARTAAALAHLYLDFIERYGAIAIQLTTDKGSETGWMYAIQSVLREILAPGLDRDVHPDHVFLKSVHNTVIEAFWRWLKEKIGLDLKEIILRGKVQGIFNPNLELHVNLFYWIFPPLIQAQLDEFRTYWNTHRVRPQPNKSMPSGHVPSHASLDPEYYGGRDCRISVPPELIAELRQIVVDEVGTRGEHLGWVSAGFDQEATDVWTALGAPPRNLEKSWEIFSAMSVVMRAL